MKKEITLQGKKVEITIRTPVVPLLNATYTETRYHWLQSEYKRNDDYNERNASLIRISRVVRAFEAGYRIARNVEIKEENRVRRGGALERLGRMISTNLMAAKLAGDQHVNTG